MFDKILCEIAQALQDQQIDYMIIGGQAALKYGVTRFTQDIDVTLGVGVEHYQQIEKMLSAKNYIIRIGDPESFVKRTMVLPVQDKKTGINIDFIFSFSTFEKQALSRSIPVQINNIPVRYVSLEDLLIHKIIAGRPRDLEDVKSIILHNPKFDYNYIENWLKEFDKSLAEDYINTFRNLITELNQEMNLKFY